MMVKIGYLSKDTYQKVKKDRMLIKFTDDMKLNNEEDWSSNPILVMCPWASH